jgi:hypothetical protein
MPRWGSVGDFNVDLIDARLWLAVLVGGMPLTLYYRDVDQIIHRNASPLSTRREAAAAFACELEEQSLPSSILRPRRVRTHFPDSALIGRPNLAFVQNGLPDQRIVVSHLSPRSVVALEQRSALRPAYLLDEGSTLPGYSRPYARSNAPSNTK